MHKSNEELLYTHTESEMEEKKHEQANFFRKYADKRFYLALNKFFRSLLFRVTHVTLHRGFILINGCSRTESLWYDSFNVSIEFHSFYHFFP